MAVVEAVPAETTDAETASDDETEGMKDDDVMAPNNRTGNFKHFRRKGSVIQVIIVNSILGYPKALQIHLLLFQEMTVSNQSLKTKIHFSNMDLFKKNKY